MHGYSFCKGIIQKTRHESAKFPPLQRQRWRRRHHTAAKRPNTASARLLSFVDEYPVKRSTNPSSGSAMPFTRPIKPSPGIRFTSAPSSVPSNVEPQTGTYTALPNLDAISISQQAELVKKSLLEKMKRLKVRVLIHSVECSVLLFIRSI